MNPFELPSDYSQEYFNVEKQFGTQLAERKYGEALEQWLDLYKKALQSQSKLERRIHKGGVLHNIGILYLFSNKLTSSYEYFLLAFIEDVISSLEGYFDNPKNAPGATNLKNLFEVDDKFLDDLTFKIQKKINTKEVYDPSKWYKELFTAQLLKDVSRPKGIVKEVQKIKQKSKTTLNKIPGSWDKRVFIGGNYRDPESILNLEEIKKIVSNLGYQSIFANDFDDKDRTIHDKSLILLHNCKYAIFEKSKDSGYLMEVERTLDYRTRVLIVQNKNASNDGISAMLTSLAVDHPEYDPKLYIDNEDLKNKITVFLNS